jgi:ssDNA-binding replication factor A large subunit
LNNVNVAGRIIASWPPKDFIRKDKTSGSITKLVLADKTGMITCVAWDRHKASLTKPNALKSKLVKINHAYTRVGLGEELELHIGNRGSISISPTELESKKYPRIEELFLNISQLNEKNIRVNIRVTTKSEPTTSSFFRRDGEGLLLKTRVTDRTGEITVIAWNAEAENLSRLSVGDTLEILNGKVKKGLDKALEIHITKNSVVTLMKKDPSK